MIPIRCDQLISYNVPEEYAVLEIVSDDNEQYLYIVNGSGEQLYKCNDTTATEQNQIELRAILDSLASVVVYDVQNLKKNNITSKFFSSHQIMVCDVASELAATIGTYDINNNCWLIRDLEEVLSFYRCEHELKNPADRAKAILWLVEHVAETTTTELTIKREQKLKDFQKMRNYMFHLEGK